MRTILSQAPEFAKIPWQRLGLAIAGILAAGTAIVFCVVAFLEHRRSWLLSLFVSLASVGIGGLLVTELSQPFAGVVSQVQDSTAPGVEVAERPIPKEKGALTPAQAQPSLVTWGEEAMVRPYREHGHHDAAWDDAAQQLIRGAALELAGSRASPGVERLRAMGAAIQQTACDDPWVLFLIRRLGEKDPDFTEAMDKAASKLTSAGYSSFPLWLARAEAVRGAQHDNLPSAGDLAKGCLEALGSALSERPLGEGDYHVWSEIFLNEPGDGLLKQDGLGVCRVVQSIPGLPEWLLPWIRGRSEIEQAWLARGEGWANSVTPEQWEQFGQHLANARASLEQSWKLTPRPETARALMTVELGLGELNGMRRWFDEAARLRFDYIPAYDSLRYGLRPRWFGSDEAVLAFGRKCLATKRFDTGVPWQMIKAVRDVASDQEDSDLYYKNQVPWDEIVETIEGYVTHGDPARRSFYLSHKAVFAAMRGRDDLGAQLLKQLNYEIDPQVAADWNLSIGWVGRMTALTGPSADLTLAAENQKRADPKAALERLQIAQRLPGLLPTTSDYLAAEIAELQAIIALNSTPWRPLTPPGDLTGWKTERGEWRVVSPTVLEAKTAQSGALITCLQPIGNIWEIRGQLNVVSSGTERAEAAFFCGPPNEQERQGFCLKLWTRPNGGSGISLVRGFGENAISKSIDLQPPIPFLVRMTNSRLRVRANDIQRFANQPLPTGAVIDSGALLGLGSTSPGESTVQFRNLEIRTVR